MEKKYVLAMYDVRGKQEFIFRTNKLQEIVGGSWIIRDIFDDYLYDAAKKVTDNKEGNDDKKVIYKYDPDKEMKFDFKEMENRFEKEGYIGEVIYEGGGNFQIIYKSKEDFVNVTYAFTKIIMEEIGTLKILATSVNVSDGFSNFKEDRKKLYEKHRLNEMQESNIVPWSCLPIVQIDRKTSQPLADYNVISSGTFISENVKKAIEKRKKYSNGKITKESFCKLYKFYSEIEKIKNGDRGSKLSEEERIFFEKNVDKIDDLVEEKGKDSKLAVVYIDGNNMGAKVADCINGKDYNEAITGLREFSKDIHENYVKEGINSALGYIKGDEENKYRIVVAAGDEINFIVNAHDAFACAENYLNHLKTKSESNGNGKYESACVGIAVFHSHAPYADAYRIAEEACESGKQKMKELRINDASFIDFHICQGAIGISLEGIRNNENGGIISRPWLMWSKNEEKIEECTSFENEVNDIIIFLNNFSRTNVKGLAGAAKESDVALKTEINRMYGHMDEESKESLKDEKERIVSLIENDDKKGKIRGIFYDISISYDLWFDNEK